ncbi:MAG: hypothetical protein ACNS63_02860 [Candidatus Nitrospinota bacterium M3_3B_026]
METIIAQVRDVKPNGPHPQIEIYFRKDDRQYLPTQHNGKLDVELLSAGQFEATIGLAEHNRPYLHSPLRDAEGNKTNCRDALARIKCGHGDALEFEIVVPRRHLRLKRILHG